MSSIPTSEPGIAPQGGGGAKMVFRVVQSLKALAGAFPQVSKDVDEILKRVEQVGMTIISQSPEGMSGQELSTDGAGSPNSF